MGLTEDLENESKTNNLILNEYVGEDIEEINESHTLIMKGLKKVQKQKLGVLEKKLEKMEKIYVKKVKDSKRRIKQEELEMKQNVLILLDRAIEDNQQLNEMNRRDKENRKITDLIFDIVRMWEEIDYWFGEIIGMREALKTITIFFKENDYVNENIIFNIRERMKKKGSLIRKFHTFAIENSIEVLSSMEDFIEFVEFGKEVENRNALVTVLEAIQTISFEMLEEEEFLIDGIDTLREVVSGIRDIFYQLPLYLLRPRVSIRRVIWDQIDAFERSLAELDV